MTQKAMTFNVVPVVTIRKSDYRIHFWFMTKSEAVYIIKHDDLSEKGWL